MCNECTRSEQTVDNSPTDPISSSLNGVVIKAWHCNFYFVVELFCSPVRNIFPPISSHDLPCHRTMKKYDDVPPEVDFESSRSPAKSES